MLYHFRIEVDCDGMPGHAGQGNGEEAISAAQIDSFALTVDSELGENLIGAFPVEPRTSLAWTMSV
jgi:hypothetical protein